MLIKHTEFHCNQSKTFLEALRSTILDTDQPVNLIVTPRSPFKLCLLWYNYTVVRYKSRRTQQILDSTITISLHGIFYIVETIFLFKTFLHSALTFDNYFSALSNRFYHKHVFHHLYYTISLENRFISWALYLENHTNRASLSAVCEPWKNTILTSLTTNERPLRAVIQIFYCNMPWCYVIHLLNLLFHSCPQSCYMILYLEKPVHAYNGHGIEIWHINWNPMQEKPKPEDKICSCSPCYSIHMVKTFAYNYSIPHLRQAYCLSLVVT